MIRIQRVHSVWKPRHLLHPPHTFFVHHNKCIDMHHHFNTKCNARIPQLYRTQDDKATTLTTTPPLCRSICNWPRGCMLCNRMRVAFWARCFMEKVVTVVNGIRKTWSTDCSDTRVGEWKIGVPILHRSLARLCEVLLAGFRRLQQTTHSKLLRLIGINKTVTSFSVKCLFVSKNLQNTGNKSVA